MLAEDDWAQGLGLCGIMWDWDIKGLANPKVTPGRTQLAFEWSKGRLQGRSLALYRWWG